MCFVTFQISTILPALGFHFQFIISPPTRGEAAPLISIMHRTIMQLGAGIVIRSCYDVLMLPLSTVPGDPLLLPCFLRQRTRGETGDWGGSLLVPLMSIITPTNLNIIHTAPGLAPAHVYRLHTAPGDCSCRLLHHALLRLICCNTGGGLLETQLWMWRFRDEEM